MTSIAHRFRFSNRSDFLLGHPIICDILPPFDSVIIKYHFHHHEEHYCLRFMHLLLPLHYILAEILLHPHSNWSFLVFSPLWLEHHNSTGGYTSWIGRTRNFVPTCIWTALTTSSFPVYNWDTLPIFQWPLFFHSPLIITISSIFTFLFLSLWLRLCLSRSVTRYSCFHLFHAFSLHCIYLCLFVHSSESPSAFEFIVFMSLPRIMLFGVNTFNWMSSSTFNCGCRLQRRVQIDLNIKQYVFKFIVGQLRSSNRFV